MYPLAETAMPPAGVSPSLGVPTGVLLVADLSIILRASSLIGNQSPSLAKWQRGAVALGRGLRGWQLNHGVPTPDTSPESTRASFPRASTFFLSPIVGNLAWSAVLVCSVFAYVCMHQGGGILWVDHSLPMPYLYHEWLGSTRGSRAFRAFRSIFASNSE